MSSKIKDFLGNLLKKSKTLGLHINEKLKTSACRGPSYQYLKQEYKRRKNNIYH